MILDVSGIQLIAESKNPNASPIPPRKACMFKAVSLSSMLQTSSINALRAVSQESIEKSKKFTPMITMI